MLRRRPALPLQDDAANPFLSWIVALMIYLAALALTYYRVRRVKKA